MQLTCRGDEVGIAALRTVSDDFPILILALLGAGRLAALRRHHLLEFSGALLSFSIDAHPFR